MQPLSAILFFLVIGWIVWRVLKTGSRDPLLPPGPPTIPIFGNLTIMPKTETYLKVTEWARQYGGIFSLKIASATTIVISSLDAVHEVLEVNGLKTADRPQREHILRIFGSDGSVGASAYGPKWRTRRRAFVETLKPAVSKDYVPAQLAEASQLMYDIYRRPDDFFIEIQRAMFSTSFSIAVGIRTPQSSSPLIRKYDYYTKMLMQIAEPGNVPPLDLLPWLKYIPERFTGHWKSRCDTIRKLQRGMFFDLLESVEVRKQMGMGNGCALENMMDRAEELGLTRESLAYTSGNLLTGSAHQITSVSRLVVLMATAYPEAQQKAHEELERVVGSQRSPTIDDLPDLPYLRAFLREIHRFRPTNPMAQPHRATEDLMYQGYLIPKGATIFLNIWGIYHDPDLFDLPDTFNPDRYLGSPYGVKPEAMKTLSVESLRKLETLHFGAGRRICPGADLANSATLLTAANLLWGFEFSPARDELGNDLVPDVWGFSSGLTNDLLPFKCTIKPRSDTHSRLIIQNYVNQTPIFETFEQELPEEDRRYVEEHRGQAIELAQNL